MAILNFNEQKKLAFKFHLAIIHSSPKSSLLKFKSTQGICESLRQPAEECMSSLDQALFLWPVLDMVRANRGGEATVVKAGATGSRVLTGKNLGKSLD